MDIINNLHSKLHSVNSALDDLLDRVKKCKAEVIHSSKLYFSLFLLTHAAVDPEGSERA